MTPIRRPGNPSASHLSKYLALTLTLIYHVVVVLADVAAEASNARPYADAWAGEAAIKRFFSARHPSHEGFFPCLQLALFPSRLFLGNNDCAIGKHGSRIHALFPLSFHLRPATRHAPSRSLPYAVCLRINAAFFCFVSTSRCLLYPPRLEFPGDFSDVHRRATGNSARAV